MTLKSKISKQYIGLLAFVGAFLLCIIISGFSIVFNNSNPYWDFSGLIIYVVFLLSFAYLIKYSLGLKRYHFESNKLIILNNRLDVLLETEYSAIADIVEFKEKGRSGDYQYKLKFSINGQVYKIRDDVYANYNDIKSFLADKTVGEIPVSDPYVAIKPKNVFIIGAVLLVISAVFLFRSNKVYNGSNTVEIEYKQIEIAKINIEKASKSTIENILIKIDKYPGFIFKIDGKAYNIMKREAYLREVSIGDTLIMTIDKDEYEAKLAKTKEPGFWLKHDKYNTINVIALRKGNAEFLSLTDYSIQHVIKIGEWKVIVLIGGGLILCIGLLLYFNSKDPYG